MTTVLRRGMMVNQRAFGSGNGGGVASVRLVTEGCGVFFFFQAEDGIRDYKVTGVQTCALPIYRVPRETHPVVLTIAIWSAVLGGVVLHLALQAADKMRKRRVDCVFTLIRERVQQIGRASCRERV